MIINKLLTTFAAVIIFFSICSAQQRIKTEADADIIEYTNKQGLPTTNISNIVQTKEGYIWISSIEGTYRFNGYEFEEVGSSHGVPEMHSLFYDSAKNYLYFASPQKFIIFNGSEFTVYDESDGYKINGLQGQVVSFVKGDSRGRIWIGSYTPFVKQSFNGGLTKFEDGSFSPFDSTSFPLDNATGFIETPYGDLIFSSMGRNTRTREDAYLALFRNDEFIRVDENMGIDLVHAEFPDQNISRSIDIDGNTWIAMKGVFRFGDKFQSEHSGVLMYDGNKFHEFPGLEKFLTPKKGIGSVHYSYKDNKVYATSLSGSSEKFSENNETIFELTNGSWVISDIIKNIRSISNLKTNKPISDFRYMIPEFSNQNEFFPELLSFTSTISSLAQAAEYPNQFFEKTSDGWIKYDAFPGRLETPIDNGFLMSTSQGIGIYYKKDYQLFTRENGFLLPESFIPNMYADKNGIVWISFSQADLPSYLSAMNVGLNIWDGKKLHSFFEKDGLSSNATFDVFHDSKNRLWISTSKGVTMCREIKNSRGEWIFKFQRIPDSKRKIYNTTRILETNAGEIYAYQTSIGLDLGDGRMSEFYVGKFDGENFIEIESPFDSVDKAKSYQFIELLESPNGELLMQGLFSDDPNEVTVARTRLMRYNGSSWEKPPESWNQPDDQLHYVGRLKSGLYFLTINGFYNFNGSRFENLIDSVSSTADFRIIKGASVAGTKTDNQAGNYLYVRLRNRGLVIFDGTNLNFYTKRNGLPSTNLYNPNPDQNGNIMFSHPSGALVVRGEKFQPYYDDGSTFSGGANVTTLDGYGNLVLHYRGLGLIVQAMENESFPLRISSVKVDTASYEYNFPDNFSHSENSVTFNYAALNFRAPKQTTYERKLEGYDNDWSRPSKLSFSEYQNLPPGSYNFRVRGITANGIKTNEAAYSFSISPPLWQTWWAYSVYIMLFGFGLFTVRKIEKKRMQIKETNRLRKERSDARIREAELRAQIAEAESERKTKELEEARNLQLSMLPKELPQLPNLDIAVYMKTATEVGGDYYDFHVSMDGTLTVVMGDATGHGMKAGTMVTAVKGLFNSYANNNDILFTFHEMTRCIKQMHMEKLAMCMTMLKINQNKMLMSAAGMPPMFIFRKEDRVVEEILIKGMPLGTMDKFPYDIRETVLTPGDTILLLSDGFPELQNSSNEQFGYKRARNLFEEVADNSPDEIVTKLKDEGSLWVENKDPDDDVTFVVIKVK